MKTLKRAWWLATSALLLAAGVAQAQTRPPAKSDGGVTPPATTAAPANPSAEPDSAGAIRYQGDPRGETESQSDAKATAKRKPADEGAPAKARNDDKASRQRGEGEKEEPGNGPVPRP